MAHALVERAIVKLMPPAEEMMHARQADRAHRVPHADEVRRHLTTMMMAAEFLRALQPAALVAVALVDVHHRRPGELAVEIRAGAQVVAVKAAGRQPAQRQHAGETAHRVGAAAEAEQENAVARLIQPDQRRVAVLDIARDPEPGGAAEQIVGPPPAAPVRAVDRRAEPGVVEGLLRARDDRTGRVELPHVGVVSRMQAAGLAGPVREDNDVLGHLPPPLVHSQGHHRGSRPGLARISVSRRAAMSRRPVALSLVRSASAIA